MLRIAATLATLLTALAVPAQDTSAYCRFCVTHGKVACQKHGKMMEKERVPGILNCSVAAECKACGGALEVDCKQCVDQLLARSTERLGGRIEIESVAALVLDLGEQRHLAAQGRCARDPVAFGQHPDHFGMGMLGNLPDQRLAVGRRHPVIGLDALFGVDTRLKLRGKRGILNAAVFAVRRVERLGVHGRPPLALLGANI